MRAKERKEMKENYSVDDFEYFSSLIPAGQDWFSPKEAGNIIGRSDQFVRDCFNTGKIMGHTSNGIAKKGEEKKTYLPNAENTSLYRKYYEAYKKLYTAVRPIVGEIA